MGSPLTRVDKKLKMKFVRLKIQKMECFTEFDLRRIWFMVRKKSVTYSAGMYPYVAIVLPVVVVVVGVVVRTRCV